MKNTKPIISLQTLAAKPKYKKLAISDDEATQNNINISAENRQSMTSFINQRVKKIATQPHFK